MSEVVTTEPKTTDKPGVFAPRAVRPNGRESEVKIEKEELGPPKTVIREYFESAVVTVIMALFGMTFIVQAVKVPTASMENTITVGDHLLVNKFVFAPGPMVPSHQPTSPCPGPAPPVAWLSPVSACRTSTAFEPSGASVPHVS